MLLHCRVVTVANLYSIQLTCAQLCIELYRQSPVRWKTRATAVLPIFRYSSHSYGLLLQVQGSDPAAPAAGQDPQLWPCAPLQVPQVQPWQVRGSRILFPVFSFCIALRFRGHIFMCKNSAVSLTPRSQFPRCH